MEAKELRIGNYVLRDKDILKIRCIGLQSHEGYIKGELTKEFSITDVLDNFSPILLTEEWLLRLGGKKKEKTKGFYYLFNGIIGLHETFYTKGFSLKPFGKDAICNVTYVHELQNLYFALTQTELTLS